MQAARSSRDVEVRLWGPVFRLRNLKRSRRLPKETPLEPVIGRLVNEVGERFEGSPGEQRAAAVIAQELTALGLEVELEPYSFVGWQLHEAPRLQLLTPSARDFASAPMLYSASTAPGGVTGTVERYGRSILIPDVFEPESFILRGPNGEDAARLYVRAGGPAMPLQNARPMYRLPQVVIGEDDGRFLSGLVDGGELPTASLELSASIVPDAHSSNVIGRLRVNSSPQRAVVCAHYDTTVGTPGAYDNASGVGGVLALVRCLVERPPDVNVDFIAFAGEEGGFFGSRYHVACLVDQGRIDEVVAVVNLDQISAGDFLWVWTGPEAFRERVEAALRAEDAFARYEVRVDPPKPGADDFPFAAEGIPTVSFIFWVPPFYHSAGDTVEGIDPDRWRLCVSAAENVVRQLTVSGT